MRRAAAGGLAALACAALAVAGLVRIGAGTRTGTAPGALSQARPIAMRKSPWIDELTWMEVRDLVAAGHDTVLLPTGGIEQNGPHVVTGKHNVVVAAMSEAIARELGRTLIAPVVPFVPEGSFEPPGGHMRYPGTIGVTEDTFRALVRDIVRSLRLHGFENIVLLGDSGGNQPGLAALAKRLGRAWEDDGVRVLHAAVYYDEDRWSHDFLKSIGVVQQPDVRSAQRGSVHSDYHYEAILAAVDPALIRYEERLAVGAAEINGVALEPLAPTIENGRRLIEHRARLTAAWIAERLSR